MGVAIPQVVTEDRASGAQVIDGSLKFDSSSSQYLTRTPTTAGNRKTFTYSCWLKRFKFGSEERFLETAADGNNQAGIKIQTNSQIQFFDYTSSAYVFNLQTTQVFRDTGWYHIVFAVDATQSTSSDRVKIYVNGTQVTDFSTETYPSNTDTRFNNTNAHDIGDPVFGQDLNAKMSQVYWIDGQQLDASEFGYTDPLTNIWRPKKYIVPETVVTDNSVSVASAAGAKPILNTTDTYGETLGSGIASDSESSTLQACWPMGTSGGLVLNDQSPTGRTSSARNITNGSTAISSSTSKGKFYGGSAYFTGGATANFSTDVWNAIGSGEFTVEYWIYLESTSMSNGHGSTILNSNVSGEPPSGNIQFNFQGTGGVAGHNLGINGGVWHWVTDDGTEGPFPVGEWVHVAHTRDSNNDVRTFKNGVKVAEGNSSVGVDNVGQGLFGGQAYGAYASYQDFYLQDVRIYTEAKYTDDFTIPEVDITYVGANNSYLPMDGNTPVGKDQSGNGNDWKPVNFGGSTVIPKATGALPILNTVNGGTSAGVGVRTDSNYSDLVLALPLVGSANDVSNSINSGSTTKTISVNGSSATSASSNFYGGSWDLERGSSQYLSWSSTETAPDTGDFTYEVWFNTESNNNYMSLFDARDSAPDSKGFFWGIDSNGQYYLYYTGSIRITAGEVITTGRWYHGAVTREGGILKMWLDGVLIGTYDTSNSNMSTDVTRLGSDTHGMNYYFDGKLQDARIYIGVAKYTSDFIPASTNPDILSDTPSGVAYGSQLTKVTDGAVSFDGSGDTLRVSSTNLPKGSSSRTIEFFVFFDGSYSNWQNIFSYGSSSDSKCFGINIGNNTSNKNWNFTGYSSGDWNTGVPTAGYAKKWTHVAVTYDGTDIEMFLDGTSLGSVARTLDTTGSVFPIGGSEHSSFGENFKGLISNFHVTDNVLYTAAFTPPSAPLTDVANTKLLCCQSNTSAGAAAVVPAPGGLNDGTIWSSLVSAPDGITDNRPITNLFNGDSADSANGSLIPALGNRWTLTHNFGSVSTLKFYTYYPSGSTSNGANAFEVNGSTVTPTSKNQGGWTTLPIAGGTLTSFGSKYTGAGDYCFVSAIEVDGTVLLDPIGVNGDVAATNFNPFTDDINTVMGQETGYCTWNPLAVQPSGHGGLRQGNLEIIADTAGSHKATLATFALPSTGKWYWEVKAYRTGGVNNGGGAVGVAEASAIVPTAASGNRLGEANSSSWTLGLNDFNARHANTVDYSGYLNGGSAVTDTGIIGIAVDMDNDKMWMHYNGTYGNAGGTGNPVTGANPMFSGEFSGLELFPAGGVSVDSGSGYIKANWGQKPFKYAPPEGFQPLNYANLPSPGVVRPDQYVGVTTYTGNDGTSHSIKGLNFGTKPDFVWIKNRDQDEKHILHDTVRGVGDVLYTTSTQGSDTGSPYTDRYQSFDVNGFTVGTTHSGTNSDGDDFVAWCWRAGGNKNTFNKDDVGYASAAAAGLSCTADLQGSSVGTKQGFSIIQYQATSGETVAHGLSQQPSFIIIKNMDSSGDWMVYHKNGNNGSDMSGSQGLNLNNDDGTFTSGSNTFITGKSATTFTVGSSSIVQNGGDDMLGYIWHDVPGLQKFGSYEGNGSADGTFVELGFKPAIILTKNIDTGGTNYDWCIYDNTRSKFNPNDKFLCPNLEKAENVRGDGNTDNARYVDFLSNGFKLRNNSSPMNASETIIYAAWAHQPMNNLYGAQSNAR